MAKKSLSTVKSATRKKVARSSRPKSKKTAKKTAKKIASKTTKKAIKKTTSKKTANKNTIKSIGKNPNKKSSSSFALPASHKGDGGWSDVFTSSLLNEGVFLLHDGKIVDVDGSGIEMLGLKNISEAKKHHLADFVEPSKLSVSVPVLSGSATNGIETLIEFIAAKGNKFSASVCSIPFNDKSGDYLVVRMRDASREIAWRRDAKMTGEMYKHLFNSSQAMNCVLDGEGYILLANEAGSKMLGHDMSFSLAGKYFLTIVHPDYQNVFKLSMNSLIESNEAVHVKFLKADAAIIDVEVTAHDIGDGQIMIEARDVTDRVSTAAALHDREKRLHGILNTVADAIVTINEKGKIIAFNKAAETIFGHSAEEAIGKNINILISSKHETFHEKYMSGYKDGNISTIIGVRGREECGRKKDGTEFPLELSVTELTHGKRKFFTGIMRDITDRKEAEKEIRLANEQLEARVKDRTKELTQEIVVREQAEGRLRLAAQVIENLNEGVIIIDPEFRIISVNPAYTDITGYNPSEVVGKHPTNHAALCSSGEMFEEMWTGIESRGRWSGEFWNKRKNGEEYAERLSITAIIGNLGEVRQFAAVVADITKRKQDEERILYQANYDKLTGLPNRSLFIDRLNQSIPTMARSNKKLALLFIDLDGFKLVNDTLGHDYGDELLKEAAERLGHCVRTGDTVARLGGDEFTITMPNLDDLRNAPIVAQRSLDALAKPFIISGHESFVSASIGITIFPDDATTSQELLKNADAAMYKAKDEGKANYQYFTADMNAQVKERMVIKNGLIKALENGELSLFYQPKMDLKSNSITAVEALMRWNNPELGNVTPDVFIPILEESGLVVEVGEWAMRTSFKQHNEWLRQGIPPMKMAVNLSVRQLREKTFVDVVENTLMDTNVSHEYFEVEITESMLMTDAPNIVAALNAIHELGIHVSMDDFGTGYSSLSYLKKFPIDTIKIDRSFVSDIATNQDDAEIIRTIINMGKTLNRKLIAEGVETIEQLDILREYGCDEIQGYYISRPLSGEKFISFYKEWIKGEKFS